MKKNLTLLTLVLFGLVTKVNAQTTIAPDTISVNTAWADTVYLDTNCYVKNNVKLTINPGTKIIAHGNYKIEVQGSLQALGSQQDSILFTIADTTGFANLAVTYGGWGGIELLNTNENNDSTIFEYCIMQYGKANGINTDKQIGGILNVNNFNKIRISNSLIQHNLAYHRGAGFMFKDSSPLIINNIFNDNYVFGQFGRGGALSIFENSEALIKNNVFKYNKAGILEFFGFGGGGAAIHLISDITSKYITVIGNKFFNNECSNGIFYESTRHTLFINNVLANNQGVTIMNGHSLSQSMYLNNTIINNDCYNYFEVIDLNSGHVKFYNNAVVGYTDNSHFSQPLLSINGQTVPSLMDDIKYNYFQYGEEYLEGEGNIVGGNPSLMFINPSTYVGFDENAETYNYGLQNSAVCVNNGILDTAGLNLPEQDIIGTQRIFGGRVDIGAYENKLMIYNSVNHPSKENKISLYPNPAHNNLQIVINNKQIGESIKILDITGKETSVVCNTKQNKQSISIDISALKAGIYFVKIGESISKFIKE